MGPVGLDTILSCYVVGILVVLFLNYVYFFREAGDPERTMLSTVVALIWPLAVIFRVWEWWQSF